MSLEVEYLCPLLEVFDMPSSLAFYRGVLGFEIVQSSQPESENADWVWLRLGGADLMLNTAYEGDARPSAPDPARIAAHRDTALYFGCGDVEGTYAYLKGKGLDIAKPVVTSYGMRQVYVRDPDGYNLCFQWPA